MQLICLSCHGDQKISRCLDCHALAVCLSTKQQCAYKQCSLTSLCGCAVLAVHLTKSIMKGPLANVSVQVYTLVMSSPAICAMYLHHGYNRAQAKPCKDAVFPHCTNSIRTLKHCTANVCMVWRICTVHRAVFCTVKGAMNVIAAAIQLKLIRGGCAKTTAGPAAVSSVRHLQPLCQNVALWQEAALMCKIQPHMQLRCFQLTY